MAQEIVTWCDVHLDGDEYVKGRTESIAFGNRKPRLVDLCDSCVKELLGPVEELLEAHGRLAHTPPKSPPTSTKSAARPAAADGRPELFCPVDGCDHGRSLFDRSSVRAHVELIHADDLATIEGRNGRTIEGTPVEFYCQADGCEAGFATAQGRGAHNRFRHPKAGAA